MPVLEIPKKQKLIVDSTNSCPSWMVTMGDAMSLLLCFFVMMLNFGSLHSDELMNVFGVLAGGNQSVTSESAGRERPRKRADETDEVAPVVLRRTEIAKHLSDLERRLAAEGYTQHIRVEELHSGLRVRIDEAVLFEGDQELTAGGQTVLRGVLNIFQGTPNEIRLAATSDPDDSAPGRAYARTVAVADFLVAEGGIERARIGCGERGSDPEQPATFDLQLMERLGTKQLTFADLWDQGEWRR